MKQELIRAITQKSQYLAPLKRGTFVIIGWLLIWPIAVVLTTSVHGKHYAFLLLIVPLWPVAAAGALLIKSAAFSSPQYKNQS